MHKNLEMCLLSIKERLRCENCLYTLRTCRVMYAYCLQCLWEHAELCTHIVFNVTENMQSYVHILSSMSLRTCRVMYPYCLQCYWEHAELCTHIDFNVTEKKTKRWEVRYEPSVLSSFYLSLNIIVIS